MKRDEALKIVADARAKGERANLRWADLREADLSEANLREADLRWANLREANLRKADLSKANLRWADLSWANLREANLRKADLSWADLSEADLSKADLSEADLSEAKELPPVPIIPDIDRAILSAIEAGGALKMGQWHTCQTTHCRAGWAVTLAGDAGRVLEHFVGPNAAGALIYSASRPGKPVPHFYSSDEDALADLRECAEVGQ